VESPTMKRVGRVGLRGALWVTLVCFGVWGGDSGVTGAWVGSVGFCARTEAVRRRVRRR
jgi:hypothetical protein